MPAPAQPKLKPGKVYRTADLSKWGSNPSRLAARLVEEGQLQELAHGLYVCPLLSKFGRVPADDNELMGAFLKRSPFLVTGPERWTELRLGATAMFAWKLIYNTKRSGEFELDGRMFWLRRVPFPRNPLAEWYVVDLVEHHDMAGISLTTLGKSLANALGEGRFSVKNLFDMARIYGSRRTNDLVNQALVATGQEQ